MGTHVHAATFLPLFSDAKTAEADKKKNGWWHEDDDQQVQQCQEEKDEGQQQQPLCTQQIYNLLIHYTITPPSNMAQLDADNNAAAGSGCNDTVRVLVVQIEQIVPSFSKELCNNNNINVTTLDMDFTDDYEVGKDDNNKTSKAAAITVTVPKKACHHFSCEHAV